MRQRELSGGAGIQVSQLCLGAMAFGTEVDEETSFAILDRFVEAGGTTIDTANCYSFWVPGGVGGESETVLGRWLARRGGRDGLVLASKVGSGPGANGGAEGLAPEVIRTQLAGSLQRLGVDHLDLYYSHREDRDTPDEQTLATFHEAVTEGKVRTLGASNHAAWRLAETRALAEARGWTPYTAVQQRYSYLLPRPATALPEGGHVHASDELLDLVRSRGLTMFAYSTLLWGSYTRPDKPLPEHYQHPGTERRLQALREVADELGVTVNQVVLSWLTGGDPAIVPIVGVSSVAQLDEALAAVDLDLPTELRKRLDEAC
ncbi:aldo/keto reductase [Micromonospora carbonacea]|uniref:Aldo/keto reductase n=1 Tax=Micromonospora carbonacea TaxID=47853 RepID=A0A1C5ARS3_9ACTN|nr:aldo/keto reductase [Micromonospora carbonacea]MBB5828523.1 aryl-alcohol dehydrogenase-like predicted oxidoreductase [Micromonospora carbonacea]QLD23878.1 aldo/keto reductase [Micromonospora carbonacea]SCF47836.1 Predicted oxidoreductase [Micromonospora carbonacea]